MSETRQQILTLRVGDDVRLKTHGSAGFTIRVIANGATSGPTVLVTAPAAASIGVYRRPRDKRNRPIYPAPLFRD